MVLDRVLENMISQQLLEEESATVVLPHMALVCNDPSVRLDAISNLLDSPSCSNSHQTWKSLVTMNDGSRFCMSVQHLKGNLQIIWRTRNAMNAESGSCHLEEFFVRWMHGGIVNNGRT